MKYSLDPILNKVSMYRLLSVTLSLLVGVSIFLSLFNQLPYTAGAMIASVITLIASAYLSNILLGKLYNVRTHDESSYITALILFFIVSPTTEPAGLAALALVAAFAMSSKYVLAVRGRHIFNPAALGALIASMIGLTHVAWWVATPILLPVVAFFAFLILYKTRRLQLGVLFILIAATLIVTLSIIDGQAPGDAAIALLSWPLVFFAGFMLSEPLTLPPRHWQQYLIGAIVAVLFAAPLELNGISSSPALALTVGNLFAFIFTQKQHIQLKFKGYKTLTPTIHEYTFQTSKPISFIPGQYMEITVPHKKKDGRGIRRIFSIIGGKDASTIKFTIKTHHPSSSFKQALQSLPVGSSIDATGINGDFILPKDTSIPLLFVAGGVGITPFISYISSPAFHNETRDITLMYTIRNPEDLVYVDALKHSGIRVIIVTATKSKLPVSSWLHINSSLITTAGIASAVPDAPRRHAYVSGPPMMVDTVKASLRHLGVKHIKSDYFTGY